MELVVTEAGKKVMKVVEVGRVMELVVTAARGK